ncbi:hypothetical protein BKA80DRAFT_268542, partial [Phyllosticta citrichinensis]
MRCDAMRCDAMRCDAMHWTADGTRTLTDLGQCGKYCFLLPLPKNPSPWLSRAVRHAAARAIRGPWRPPVIQTPRP